MAIASYSQKALSQDLRGLGVGAGATIFIHSSFRSLGSVIGGAGTVVGAFKDVVNTDALF